MARSDGGSALSCIYQYTRFLPVIQESGGVPGQTESPKESAGFFRALYYD